VPSCGVVLVARTRENRQSRERQLGLPHEETQDDTGISCVTVEEIYRQERISSGVFPFLVKIDIEGAEADVFAKNTDWVSEARILVVELHDWLFPKQGKAADFLKRIAAEPRDFITMGENVFSISYSLG
jgi:hypothetical protein